MGVDTYTSSYEFTIPTLDVNWKRRDRDHRDEMLDTQEKLNAQVFRLRKLTGNRDDLYPAPENLSKEVV